MRVPRRTSTFSFLLSRAAIDAALDSHDFVRESRTRLRHSPTRVKVDLLIEGEPIPRSNGAVYPAPTSLNPSADDVDVASLSDILTLNLHAHRHQDLADVVALLKAVDDPQYLELESQIPAALRNVLSDLRRDAKEELEGSSD